MEDKKIVTLTALKEYDKHKQNLLVSGTNIKTINGETLLGSGDIEIKGGTELTYATIEDINEIFSNNTPNASI